MNLEVFRLDTMAALDNGKAVATFAQHLQRAALDCYDRPGDGTARKVTLEVSLTPVLEEDRDCTEVSMQMRVASVLPKHQTKVYSLGLRQGGKLVFNPDSPSNINQSTFEMNGDDE